MAQFSNSSDGSSFDSQCGKCKYGKKPCPIALVQIEYNYDQLKDTTGISTKILNTLIKEDGTCTVLSLMKQDLEIDPNQLELF